MSTVQDFLALEGLSTSKRIVPNVAVSVDIDHPSVGPLACTPLIDIIPLILETDVPILAERVRRHKCAFGV